MITRKNRDEKPTLLKTNEFLMSLGRSSCDTPGERLIQTRTDTGAYFKIPENAAAKLCVDGSVGSQTYFTPRNPFEYSPNAGDLRTPVLGLSVLGDRQKVPVSDLDEEERIEYINPVTTENTIMVEGTATSSNSGQITVHNFNTTAPGVAFFIRVVPQNSADVNVTFMAYLKRGAEVSPNDYSHNATLRRARDTADVRGEPPAQPLAWFLSQAAVNISDAQETWTIGIQRLPTVDGNGRTSDSGVNYTISITASRCLFFSETSKLWTDSGCEVGPETTHERLHCICDHLTAFAGFAAPNPLDLGKAFTFDLDRSLIAIATVCVVLALYMVAVSIGRRLDIQDERKRQKRAYRHLSRSATPGKRLLSWHLWASVVKPPVNHFSRVQRISCCLSLLMSFMLVNIMFYRGDRNFVPKPVTVGDTELELPFSWDTFIIGLESSLIALPINVFIVVLFRYAGARPDASAGVTSSRPGRTERHGFIQKGRHGVDIVLPRYLPTVEGVGSRYGTEYTANQTLHVNRFRRERTLKKIDTRYVIKKKGGKVAVSRKPYRPFPWWCVIVAWLLVAAIVIVSGAFTVLYGNDYGRAKSQAWLFAFLISFLTDVIILQPVKIILLIIFFKLVCKRTKVTDETITTIQSRVDEMEENLWERRRRNLLGLYRNRYARDPTAQRPHTNVNGTAVRPVNRHAFVENDLYGEQHLAPRHTYINTPGQNSINVFSKRDLRHQGPSQDRQLDNTRKSSDMKNSNGLATYYLYFKKNFGRAPIFVPAPRSIPFSLTQ